MASNALSASLTIQTIMVQPTTTTNTAVGVASTSAKPVKTQELSGVWCPLLMTLPNNSFYSNKPYIYYGNSSVLHKPQIQYHDRNNTYKPATLFQKQKQLQQYHQTTSGLTTLCDAINPKITLKFKDTPTKCTNKSHIEVICENYTNLLHILQNTSASIFIQPNLFKIVLFSHKSQQYILCYLQNSNTSDLETLISNHPPPPQHFNNEIVETAVQCAVTENIESNIDKLSLSQIKRQMLMKWFLASLQNNCNHLSEQDISTLTLQYCNNLINVGVLKQISEKNDLETFKPFQMYQWTHTEAPTTSQPHTPGKLDKVSAWPYCSTPTGVTRLPKAIQVDSPQAERDNGFLPMLRKRLLSCSNIVEVHGVVNDMLSGGEPLRRPSKRCMQLTDLLSTSEATVYQYDRNTTETSSGCESGVQEAAVQTEEISLAMQEFVCCKCNSLAERPHEVLMCEVGVQVSLNDEMVEKKMNDSKPPIPPPPPPPMCNMAPPPPPPPMPPPLNFAPPPPPPPPTSVSPLPPPPPPPPNGAGPPPPPPAPPGDPSLASTPLSLNTSTVPPPPPPGAPKTPSSATPAPLPNPAEGGWFNQANTLRKTAVNPPKPMKPLYWTRIVTQPAPPKPQPLPPVEMSSGDATDSSSHSNSPDEPSLTPKEIWQEIDETNLDNIDEFTELFSREAVVPKVVPKIKAEVRVKTMKVLDSKRSQNVGIISRSSHVDFFEIEHAIYHVDTSVVSLETLQQIINIKATNEELELIKEAAQGDIPLDYPEKFLLKISQISMSTERISCIVFMADFEEAATVIERKLEVVMQLSQFLVENEELKSIFAIILTLGNYMNGGNRQRGQADGFTLEILSKLKDVKSKESQTTLLHFIVRTYISRKRKEGVQLLEIPLPIPEPSDVERATQVDFDEVKRQINDLSRQLKSSKDITERVIINSTAQNLEPFKSKMEEFIQHASKEVDKIYKELNDCRDVFIETMKFYHFQPKTGTLDQCTPKKFYEHWTNFTNDFKDIMKKEIAVLWNELLKKSKDAAKRNKTVKTTKVKPGGLKERIMRLNKK